jgi:hypothetical protein
MGTIPTSLTEKQFKEHALPYLSVAKRGYVCQIPLYKVFNYILYRYHTGCQWHQLPIEPDEKDRKKKKSAMMRFTTTFASGVGMAVWSGCGKVAS